MLVAKRCMCGKRQFRPIPIWRDSARRWRPSKRCCTLAQQGKVNRDGLPNTFQLAVLLRSMQPNTYLAGLPVAVQRPLFGLLAAVGQAAGYRASYPEQRYRPL